ncbi:hypothetical protein, partial [Citrobacter freundii]|uniref:hypothetical protein n=1 Tax=Citrobacter freundii TaxID=546 RepID=UPI001A91C301
YENNHDTYDFGWAKLLKDNPDSITTAIQNADKTAGKITIPGEFLIFKFNYLFLGVVMTVFSCNS